MDFYMGQIVPIAFGYAPKYTALCSGQTIPITQNSALYALLGAAYGGDGRTNFALPNTTGRSIVGFGNNGSVMTLGTLGGEAAHTLTLSETPTHTHALNATDQGSLTASPANAVPGTPSASAAIYGSPSTVIPLGGMPLAGQGGSQPHANLQPSLAINFAIVLNGIFPSRS